ncbi:cob(I)yrinic acid a,c-diamide adenosyltransferase [Calycomorphotria hydatis]|uniref:Corrinoid adenosyltransferase n=1 Tax=Calycomorphotria hydatis TaxID=2528027 RepID=A0A517TBE1_9PLAN|nr:cob(I)yrinic acid a,c-diamide adenosyltransferase [Calycomorphotria hydatis]QDT65688.1 Cob(I)yrinic acid a,c-diamide adenosyltransferase [Calycomorphotria hydatis]
MVHLDRIYTKSGDEGQTGLGDGTRCSKTSQRVISYGTVDELNCVLGIAITQVNAAEMKQCLQRVQNDLFDLGADLCVPESKEDSSSSNALRITERQVTFLEKQIDEANERLEPLRSFILPGGSPASAHLHHARAVCRRAEIEVWRLIEREPVNKQVPIYLNRLSDLLFVLARIANDNGQADVLWQPGAAGEDEAE